MIWYILGLNVVFLKMLFSYVINHIDPFTPGDWFHILKKIIDGKHRHLDALILHKTQK